MRKKKRKELDESKRIRMCFVTFINIQLHKLNIRAVFTQ